VLRAYLHGFQATAALEFLLPALAAAALLELGTGDPPAAVAHVREFAQGARGHGTWYRVQCLSDLARVCREAGEIALAHGLLEGVSDARIPRIPARPGLRAGRSSPRPEAIEEAARRYLEAAHGLEQFGWVVEQAECLLGAGRCLVQLGRPTEGTDALRTARELFAGFGAPPRLAECDTWLGRATALSS
jgi:hypothetical protein